MSAAAPRRVLVIVTRRLGDVLLATPVLRSLKRAWPDARIDALVFAGGAAALEANPDVSAMHVIGERPALLQHLVFVARLFRRYDLALSLVPGDRPTFYAWAAGRRRVGLLLDTKKEAWKQRLLHQWVTYDLSEKHTLLTHLGALAPLSVPPLTELVAAWGDSDAAAARNALAPLKGQRHAVLHLYPKFAYKMWHEAGWLAVAQWLHERGYAVVLTGSADAGELAYVNAIASRMAAPLNLAGRLTFAQSACVLAEASAYVGPDTAMTHLAAALNVPAVTFFGPTDPLKWAPWPQGHPATHTPWRRLGDQTHGKLAVLQGRAACAPCNKEGCGRRVTSHSDCLMALPAEDVVQALASLLETR
jgi:heptosyltransferase-3